MMATDAVYTVKELALMIDRSRVITRTYLKCLRVEPSGYIQAHSKGGRTPVYNASVLEELRRFKDVPNKKAIFDDLED
jgi:hypothetical protein